MANIKLGALKKQKLYTDDGVKHFVSTTELSANYWQVYYGARTKALGVGNPAVLAQEQTALSAMADEEPKTKIVYKKNKCAVSIGFAAIVLLMLVVVFNAFKIYANYDGFFAACTTKDIYKAFVAILGNPENFGLLTHAYVGTTAVTAVLVVACFVLGIVMLASKKRIAGTGFVSLAALVFWLATGIIKFFELGITQESAYIIKYINPLDVNIGIMLGYYIEALFLIIATICGFCAYKKEEIIVEEIVEEKIIEEEN